MHKLNHTRPLIQNGTVLILTSGVEVTVVNDRGYQLSVRDMNNSRPLVFITPDEIATINNFSEKVNNDKFQSERTNPNDNFGRPSNLLGD